MSKQFESFPHEKRLSAKRQRIANELMAELASLSNLSDSQIDLLEMPEELAWSGATVGKYYRPIKEQISIRIDADLIGWFKALGKGYQSRINEALRHYVLACNVATQKRTSRSKPVSSSPTRAKGKSSKRRKKTLD